MPVLTSRLRSLALLGLLCLSAAVWPLSAGAHECVLIPEAWQTYRQGQVLPLSVFSTHVFVKSEELEAEGSTKVAYEGKDVPLTANTNWLSYDGKITLKGGGAAVIAAHRLPMLYSRTPDGGRDGGRSVNKDALFSGSYEKFAKLILPVDGKSGGFDARLGHRLEIVPVDNPLEAVPGDEIRLKILLDGKPAAVDEIKATYAGFSDIPDAWAFTAPPVAHGEARVRLSAPGLWIVRVGVELDEKTAEYDQVILRAVLAFPVK